MPASPVVPDLPPYRSRPGAPLAGLVAAVVAGVVAVGCSSAGSAAGTEASTAGQEPAPSTISGADSGPGPSSPPSPIPTSVTAGGAKLETVGWCTGLEARASGQVANAKLSELSGLAASQRFPGVIWAHNDSGHQAAVFALGPEGEDLGSFPLSGVKAIDIEDMALTEGMVYLADTGDNNQDRDEVSVYRFAEPDPANPGRVDGVDVLRFRYPDGPHDAEALLVDPASDDLIIIDKQLRLGSGDAETLLSAAPAQIFAASPPHLSSTVTELRAVGTIALDQLTARRGAAPASSQPAQLGLGGLVTGADIGFGGHVIALRTYDTIWLYDRPPGTSVAQALAGVPCEAPSVPERQGESVAFLAGAGVGLVTASEDASPELHVITAGPSAG